MSSKTCRNWRMWNVGVSHGGRQRMVTSLNEESLEALIVAQMTAARP